VVLNTLAPLLVVAVAWWLKLLVDAAAAGDGEGVLVAAAGLGATGASGRLASWAGTRMFFPLKERTGMYLDRRLVELAAGTPGLEHHERPEYVSQVEMLRLESHVLAGGGNAVSGALAVVVQAGATAAVLASVNPLLLTVPLFAVPSFWAATRAERLRQAALDGGAEDYRRARHLFELATFPGPGKELRVFGLGQELQERHRLLWQAVDARLDAAGRQGLAWTTAGWCLFALGYAGAIGLVVRDAAAGDVTLGSVVLTLALLARINMQVSVAHGTTTALARMMRVARRYLWLDDYASTARARLGQGAPVPERLTRGIELQGVGFRYPDAGTDVLSGVDLFLPAGSTVALVGDNGAGKTTLVKLLGCFYDATAGTILVDGVDLRSLDVDQWRSRMAAGFQDFARLELLAREAVGVGDLPHLDDVPAVEGALWRAGASEVTPSLAHGLESPLGPSFEGGTELSGGQWQKLALARAMMREAPLLLVLDEPTASVDAGTEHALFERYAGAARTVGAATGASPCWSPTGSPPCGWLSSSWCSTAGGWSRPAATPSSWPTVASTPSSTSSRPAPTAERGVPPSRASRPGPGSPGRLVRRALASAAGTAGRA